MQDVDESSFYIRLTVTDGSAWLLRPRSGLKTGSWKLVHFALASLARTSASQSKTTCT